MAPKIGFHNDGSPYRLRGKRAVGRWIAACIEKEGYCSGEISYIFYGPERHLEINRQYLGHDYPTDVITFDYTDPETKTVSGDIFIDPATVRGNARRFGQTARREMLRVMVHGVLHLCGYKDKTAGQQAVMRAKEEECLALADFD